jgi:Domain of unknown function (DUF4913)
MTIDLSSELDEGLTLSVDADLDDGLTGDAVPVGTARLRRRRRGVGRRPPLQRMRRRPAARENFYPHVAAFVTGFLAEVYAHEWREQDGSWRWCAQWWSHTEALVRLEALWKAWEVLRLDPGAGASTWLRDHADPTMAALTSPAGPFTRCTPVRHATPSALVTAPPPAALFARDLPGPFKQARDSRLHPDEEAQPNT